MPNGTALLNSSSFVSLSRRVEAARVFLQGLCACALGDVAGAGHIYDMLDRVSRDSGGRLAVETLECPDVPAFLCEKVVKPQLNGQVREGKRKRKGGGNGSGTWWCTPAFPGGHIYISTYIRPLHPLRWRKCGLKETRLSSSHLQLIRSPLYSLTLSL
jgi:hypothetical protein